MEVSYEMLCLAWHGRQIPQIWRPGHGHYLVIVSLEDVRCSSGADEPVLVVDRSRLVRTLQR